MDKLFHMAFEALRMNKVRAFLTMLGIIIGVFSVIVMIGLGQASQASITDQVKGLGANVLIVSPGNPKAQSFGPPGGNGQSLELKDGEALELIPGVRYVSPNAFIQSVIKYQRNTLPATILGSNITIKESQNLTVAEGRFYNDQEVRRGAKVIILGAELATNLFEETLALPLGSKVQINNQRYRIIGILKKQGSGLFGSTDTQAFMPISTFQQTIKAKKGLNSLLIQSKSEDLLPIIEAQIRTRLRYRHSLRVDDDDDFKIQTQAEILETVGSITRVFTFLLAGIAGISLVVGGIGIMNIMLVSVTERTREIGIRKALGATRKDILVQFLIESGTLSLAGGLIGIVLGVGVTKVATQLMGLPFVLSQGAIIGAFMFSAGVGIFFGLYPANKASKLDPVDALRYE
jgi:putative ABC transport system permease protein